MVKKNTLTAIFAVFVISILFSSCSTTNDNNSQETNYQVESDENTQASNTEENIDTTLDEELLTDSPDEDVEIGELI